MANREQPFPLPLPGVAVVDIQGRVHAWDANAQRLTGWPAGERLGRPFPVACSDDPEDVSEGFLSSLTAPSPEGFPISLRTRDGATLRLQASVSGTTDSGDYIVLLVPLAADAPPLAGFEAALFPNENPNPVLRIATAGAMLYENEAAQALRRDLAGPEGEAARAQLLEAAERAARDGERRAVTIPGAQSRVFAFDCVPFPDRGYVNLYGRDITPYRRSEEMLAKERSNLQSILDAVSVGMLLVNTSGAVQRVNNTVSRWTGQDPGQPPEGQPGDVIGCVHAVSESAGCGHTPHCRTCALRFAFESVLTDGEPVRGVESDLTLSRGGQETSLCLEINADPLHLNGERHVLIALHNITERKMAEDAVQESRQDLNRAQLVAHTGSWRLDVRNNELTWSEEAHRIFGIPPGTPLSYETFLSTLHPEDREFVDREWTQALAGAPYDCEHRILVGDTVKWVREKAELEFEEDGGLRGGFGVVQDITERKRMEMELQERARDLAAADRAKDDFLAMLAHELRNPLGAIGNATALIEMRANGDDFLRTPVGILGRQVRHAARLVDDLLDVARFSRGKVDLRQEMIDLGVVVHRAAEVAHPQMEAAGHAFTVSIPRPPLWLEGDGARLEQVIGNLLSNAAKYTDPGGHVTLTLMREEDAAVVCVTDDGQGIAEEMLPRIFDLFAQEDRSLARSKGGLGIGLTLAKKLVEMHGGTLEARSQGPGRGSTFITRLPLLEESRQEGGPLL